MQLCQYAEPLHLPAVVAGALLLQLFGCQLLRRSNDVTSSLCLPLIAHCPADVTYDVFIGALNQARIWWWWWWWWRRWWLCCSRFTDCRKLPFTACQLERFQQHTKQDYSVVVIVALFCCWSRGRLYGMQQPWTSSQFYVHMLTPYWSGLLGHSKITRLVCSSSGLVDLLQQRHRLIVLISILEAILERCCSYI